MGKLTNQAAIVTGGANGIGKEISKRFLQEGAKVLVVDLFDDALDKAKDELSSLGHIETCQADVSKENDVKKYVDKALDAFGTVDVFVNNAGIEGKVKPIPEQSIDDYQKVMDVNVKGVFLGLQYVMPIMHEKKSGSIINMSSVAGLEGSAGVAPYVTSKHAVTGLTKVAALEGGANQVRVNSVHPSPVNTRMMRSLEKGFNPDDAESVKTTMEQGIPLGRYGESEDIANMVLFLASDEAKFITGVQYRVDGGMGAS